MKQRFLFILFLTWGLNFKCINSEEKCNPNAGAFAGKQKYITDGCLINNLEQGTWSFYDSKQNLIEQGFFDKGIRIGKWHYPWNTTDSVIVWKRYTKPNINLEFNVPVELQIEEDGLDLIKFSNNSSKYRFTLVLAISSIDHNVKNLDQYYKVGIAEIKRNGWDFSREQQKLINHSNTIYFNDYSVKAKEDSFKIFNMYRQMKDGKLLEITCRYNKINEQSSRIVFFSVLSNCFYKKQRFLSPFDKITLANGD